MFPLSFPSFPHRFHQTLAAVTSFALIVPVLSSISELVRKIGLVFAYGVGIRRSIYRNRLARNFRFGCPLLCRGRTILKGSKAGLKILFFGHNLFVNLSVSSENSTGHTFHLFQLKFSVVTSFVLLDKRKISKK